MGLFDKFANPATVESPAQAPPAKPAARSSIEMFLRQAGLSQVLDMAQALVEAGALQKILKFADDLEAVKSQLARLDEHVQHTQSVSGGVRFSGTELYACPYCTCHNCAAVHNRAVEPGSDTGSDNHLHVVSSGA